MEENTLIESKELACKALFAKKWARGVGVSITSIDLEDSELDIKLDQNEDILLMDASSGINLGLNVAGPLASERSYAMGLSEWADYYWPFVGQQGLACLIPNTITAYTHYEDSFYPVRDIARTRLSIESTQLISFLKSSTFDPPLSEELFNFCSKHNMLNSLQISLRLIRSCFPSSREVRLQPEQDPDTGEEWLVIDFEIAGEIKDILDNYDKYTDLWVKSIPWPEREKIRLSYNIL